jgi:putative RNA 2'-phosphotransferase
MSSKFLTWLLRHKLEGDVDEAGWIDIEKLINICKDDFQRTISRDNISNIVLECKKQRFQISDNGLKIRATQGHSIKGVKTECLLKPFIKIDDRPVYHATFKSHLDAILKDGLKPMTRNHVHFSQNESMLRKEANVWIELDDEKWIADGNNIYISNNEVILIDTIVDPKYFRSVIFKGKIKIPNSAFE